MGAPAAGAEPGSRGGRRPPWADAAPQSCRRRGRIGGRRRAGRRPSLPCRRGTDEVFSTAVAAVFNRLMGGRASSRLLLYSVDCRATVAPDRVREVERLRVGLRVRSESKSPTSGHVVAAGVGASRPAPSRGRRARPGEVACAPAVPPRGSRCLLAHKAHRSGSRLAPSQSAGYAHSLRCAHRRVGLGLREQASAPGGKW